MTDTTVVIQNKNCTINSSSITIPNTITICAPEGSQAQKYAEKNGNPFTVLETLEALPGDVDHNGSFNVTDIIQVQKWLLSINDIHLVDWKAADFNQDDKINIYDLCLMKRALLNS